MAIIRFTQALQAEYENLYRTCEIKPEKFAIIDTHVDQIVDLKTRYRSIENRLSIPWFVVAAIHTMESSRNFDRHLHNGDRLTDRTVQVPAGRPADGHPPFTWEESAQDAMVYSKLDRVDEWNLPRILYELEKYNGWGYRKHHPHVKSPYLWSYSNQYVSGKYVADGTWSETAVSRQSGAAVIIRRLEERGEIDLLKSRRRSSFFKLSNRMEPRADDLQRFLNTFDGITLRVDGWPGSKTSDAVHKLFGYYLRGDERNES